MMQKIEIRIPAYKRPAMLKRALESLLAQTFPHWEAIVFDDSPKREAEAVVAYFKDPRIHYQANPTRLGGAENIDQAFSVEPLLGGGFACILEDDNWLLPKFLEENLAICEKNNADIVLRNQEVWIQTDNAEKTSRTTRGKWFNEGWIVAEKLHSSLYLFEGISNGGLFWRLNASVNLVVGPAVQDSGLQEYCRTWQIDRKIWFAIEPLAVWSSMDNSQVTRSILKNRAFATGCEIIGRMVYRTYGNNSIALALELARKRGMEEKLLNELARIGVPQVILKNPSRLILWGKGFIRRLATKNPLAGYPF